MMFKRKLSNGVSFIGQGLQEVDVYITEWVCDFHFPAIIKERFTDFQVFEIDEDGKEVHLTSLENNLKPIEKSLEKNVNLEEVDVNEEPVKNLCYPITEPNQWKQLTLLMKRKKNDETIKIDVSVLDKQGRTALHEQISKRYNGLLCTRTVDEENLKILVVSTNKHIDTRNNRSWSKKNPQYLHFVMFKQNIDTMSAIRKLCQSLRLNPKAVTYAGTKDRRGVTTQRVSVRKLLPERVYSTCKNNLWFGDFKYESEPLKLGQLKGNRFVVALRKVESSDENIEITLENLKEKGFINYFGLQRFGVNVSAPTYKIGKCLLQNDWQKAIKFFLTPNSDSKENDTQDAIRVWNEKSDAKEAVKCLSKYNHSTESIILRTLAKQGNTAYVNALQQLPRNIVLLCIHSFQSVVYNEIISRRIKQFGLQVLPGDLVYTSDSNNILEVNVEDVETEFENLKSVRPITAEEVEKFSIYNIVYPLPGNAVQYPKNEIKTWYEDILSRYNVTDFNCKNKMFAASGAYRKIMTLPENVKWKVVYYNDPIADLIQTDLQKLKNENTIQNLESGSYKAVIVEFTLPTCSYATMALREVTKADSSSAHQASLSFSHLQNKKVKLENKS